MVLQVIGFLGGLLGVAFGLETGDGRESGGRVAAGRDRLGVVAVGVGRQRAEVEPVGVGRHRHRLGGVVRRRAFVTFVARVHVTVKSAHVPGPEPRAILQRLIALLRVPLQMPLHSAHFR